VQIHREEDVKEHNIHLGSFHHKVYVWRVDSSGGSQDLHSSGVDNGLDKGKGGNV